MKYLLLFWLTFLAITPAFCQSTAEQVQPGLLTTSSCPSGSTVCFKPYSATNQLPIAVYDAGNNPGFCFTSNGSGSAATFQACGGGGSSLAVTSTSGNATFYPLFATTTGASVSTIYVSTPNFTFNPSTGNFSIPSGGLYEINGTQIAASNLSNGTTGSGSIVLATSPSVATPTVTTSLTISNANIITDTTTGTDFGTSTSQKIGFFNATPVVQQSGVITTALSNLGLVASPVLPNPAASTLGGVESIAATSHEWINAISTGGVPSQTQPACGDLSNSGTACQASTGTSGGTVPLLNGINTWSALQTFNSGDLAIGSTTTGIGVFNGTGVLSSSEGPTVTGTITAGALTLSTTPLAYGSGGTGATSFTNLGVVYAGASALQSTATVANAALISSSTGVPSFSTVLPSTVQQNITALGSVTTGSLSLTGTTTLGTLVVSSCTGCGGGGSLAVTTTTGNATFYPLFATTTGASVSTIYVNTPSLTYNPSTTLLTTGPVNLNGALAFTTTAAAPTTGITSPSANALEISTSGTEAVNITNTGLADIGTATPTDALQVTSGSAAVDHVTALTISTATFTPTFGTANDFSVTLVHASCPCTLANPSGTIVPGQHGVFYIIQSATGSDTVTTWGSEYLIAGGTSAITLSSGASDIDVFTYVVKDATHIVLSGPALNVTH